MRTGQTILLATTAAFAVTAAYADDAKVSEKGPFSRFNLGGPYPILESVRLYGHSYVKQTGYDRWGYFGTESRSFRNIPWGYQIVRSNLYPQTWRFPEASDVEDFLQGKTNRLNGFDYAPGWNWNESVEPDVNF
jgi:hypothetical protein